MTPDAAVAAGTLDMAKKKTTTKRKVVPGPKPSVPGAIFVRLELTPEAKEQTAAVADRLGMTQIAALSRLVEWFAGQPAELHAAVLNDPPSSPAARKQRDQVTRMILGPIATRR